MSELDTIKRELIDQTNVCLICGKKMEYEIDETERKVWLSCPEYIQGTEEHTKYSSAFDNFL